MQIKEYIRADGTNPYQKWFNSLNATAATKMTIAKVRLELGNTSNIKWFDGIGEYRIDWGAGYRIYLAQDGQQLIILFGSGTKKSQQKDIDNAKKLFNEYKLRKKQEKHASHPRL